MLCFAMLLMLPLRVTAVNATVYKVGDYEPHYKELMSEEFKEYYISAQPSSALVLASEVQIKKEDLSGNYAQGVVDLPRLTANYRYGVTSVNGQKVVNDENNVFGFRVNRTLYPSLSWNKKVNPSTELELSIIDEIQNKVVKKCKITFSEALLGISSDFADCSTKLCSNIINNNSSKYNGTVKYYPRELHKDSIVTSNFVVGYSANFMGFKVNLMSNPGPGETVKLDGAENFPSYLTSVASSINLKEEVRPYIPETSDGKLEMFAAFEPVGQGVMYDSNTGVVTSERTAGGQYSNVFRGVYFIATGNDLQWYTISKSPYAGNTTDINPNSPLYELKNGEEFDISNKLGKYGFEEFINSTGSMFDKTKFPIVSYKGETEQNFNVYQRSFAYSGVKPNVATLKCLKPAEKFSIVTWYTVPGNSQLKKCEELSLEVGGSAPTLKTPSEVIDMYSFDTWYTDSACTKKADLSKIMREATEGAAVSLYGKFAYIGGTYTVQFYNDATNESSTAEFECREQPTLPTTPTRSGYLFRNWQIVYTTASTTGTAYDPSTFNPQPNMKYLFKTFWDIEGVITSVLANQKEYYVGDTIDKSKLVVTLQTDNTGKVRTLNTDEYTVSPEKMPEAGTQQFQVTYKTTGATATVDLVGKPVSPVSISARYTGTELPVGSTINKNTILVTLNYSNQTTEEITDFTIAPSTITNSGGNTIKVLHGNLSTIVSVPGKKATSSGPTTVGSSGGSGGSGGSSGGGSTTKPGSSTTTKPGGSTSTTNKSLQSIVAYYKGQQPYAGDSLNANDIVVTANYTDGSVQTLSSTMFQYSPSMVKDVGANTIVVTYQGKQSIITINALARSGSSTVPDGSSSTIVGVDEDGNPIYGPSSGSGTTSGTGTQTGTGSAPLAQLGNPLTGAGMSSGDKGTSIGYLHGNNILTSRLYGGSTSVTNDLDILEEIKIAGDSASSVTIKLYNGASGNDITTEMLKELKKKELTLYLNMVNPDMENQTVAQWTIVGEMLVNTDTPFNPNVSFEVTDRDAEVLTYIAVLDGKYPDNCQLTTYPATGTYASGELIRVYSCEFDKSNSLLEKSFTWQDSENPIVFNIAKSTRYCLSNAELAYPDGSSLNESVALPSLGEDTVVSGEEEFEFEDDEEEFDFGEEEWDWDEETDDTTDNDPVKPKKFNILWIVIVGVIVVVLFVVGLFLVKKLSKGNKVHDYTEASDTEYDDYPIEEYSEEMPSEFDEDVDADVNEDEGLSDSYDLE